MSYHVRNPSRRASQQHHHPITLSEQQQEQQFRRRQDEVGLETDFQWTYFVNGGVERVSNSDSSDLIDDYSQDENDDYVAVVQKDEAAFTSLLSSNDPLVTYSSRAPNYPIGYSCEHFLLHTNENGNISSKDVNATINDALELSYSNDEKEEEAIILQETDVSMLLELQIPASISGDYNKVLSNIEALQWSILNQVAKQSGLAKGCKVDVQYDDQTLPITTTAMNDVHASLSETNQSHSSGQSPSIPTSSITNIDSNNKSKTHSNDTKNRRRARALTSADQNFVLSLPYPTSVYSVDSTRPKWIVSCSGQIIDSEQSGNQCVTAQINLAVKYRGEGVESDSIEQYIQSIVHKQIAFDASQLFAEDISGLKWITNEDSSAVIDAPNGDQSSKAPIFFRPKIDDNNLQGDNGSTIVAPTDDASDALFASVMIPLTTAFILLLVWLFAHRYYGPNRRNRRSAQRMKYKGMTGLSVVKQTSDIETGSDSTEATREVVSKDSSDSNSDSLLNISPATSSSSSSSSSSASSPLSLSKRSKKSMPISVDSPERSAAGLPPRPMVVKREVSKQLKKQRKKKRRKKKKVMALQRISSRDTIAEMPMISESESECDSESGDEESYQNDDASSYDASGGYLTPSRRSRTSSRASSVGSPPKSPRDDLVPVDSTNSYEFVMEAPEFSQDVFAQLRVEKEIATHANATNENRPLLKVPLQPKPTDPKINPVDANKETNQGIVSIENERERRSLEIEPQSELDSSFSKEHGSVMERMMPLPWLASSKNPKIL